MDLKKQPSPKAQDCLSWIGIIIIAIALAAALILTIMTTVKVARMDDKQEEMTIPGESEPEPEKQETIELNIDNFSQYITITTWFEETPSGKIFYWTEFTSSHERYFFNEVRFEFVTGTIDINTGLAPTQLVGVNHSGYAKWQRLLDEYKEPMMILRKVTGSVTILY